MTVRLAVTGTPGTGKTTAVELVETDLAVVHLNEVVRREGLHRGRDERRDTLVADLAAVEEYLTGYGGGDGDERTDGPADEDGQEHVDENGHGDAPLLVESHLAHRLPADRVVVLRCHPDVLRERLRERGEPAATVEENAESEALDLLLAEAVERHGADRVHEIDATDRTPAAVAREIEAVLAGEREPGVGTVDFGDALRP